VVRAGEDDVYYFENDLLTPPLGPVSHCAPLWGTLNTKTGAGPRRSRGRHRPEQSGTERELQQVRGIGKKRAAEIVRVLRSDYEAVDTERNLEDAIEAAPWLPFDCDVELVARQHAATTDQGDRYILDLVTYAPDRDELILVELKRGTLPRTTKRNSSGTSAWRGNRPCCVAISIAGRRCAASRRRSPCLTMSRAVRT